MLAKEGGEQSCGCEELRVVQVRGNDRLAIMPAESIRLSRISNRSEVMVHQGSPLVSLMSTFCNYAGTSEL